MLSLRIDATSFHFTALRMMRMLPSLATLSVALWSFLGMLPSVLAWIATTKTSSPRSPGVPHFMASHSTLSSSSSSSSSSPRQPETYYNYFAYGSNMLPETMECLRNIRNYRNATAAVLPNYQLIFRGAAAVESKQGSVVHGVLYTLDEKEFDIVSRTEGVSTGFYQWIDCQVVPYIGDSSRAGETALAQSLMTSATTAAAANGKQDTAAPASAVAVSAQTLAFSKRSSRFPLIPFQRYALPSQSYLQILKDGAKYWKLDRSYQIRLSQITTTCNRGPEGMLLQIAKLLNPPSTKRR